MDLQQRVVNLAQKAELFASKGVDYHHRYARWRLRRLASGWQRTPALPTDSALATKLTHANPALAETFAAFGMGDVKGAHAALLVHFRTRTAPCFAFTHDEREAICALVDQLDSAGKARTIALAEQLCQNTFVLRGAPSVHFATAIDWLHAPDGNTDWRWDLNRHAYFETLGRAYAYTGDTRYVAKFVALLRDWLAHNPAHVHHPNWSSVFEVAFRINSWLWALHLFLPALDAESLALLLAGLWVHGDFLDRHLELHARNNHLLLEAKALAMVGLLLPEFGAAHRWRTRGLNYFVRELGEQVCADGVHGERASLYHRIISGELLELLVVAAANGVALPASVGATLGKMAEFELWITKPDGQISLVGDSALEDVHLRFNGASGGACYLQRHDLQRIAPPLGEGEIWLLGPARLRQVQVAPVASTALPSRAFAEGGYFVQRAGAGSKAQYALFDCGPFGYHRDGTHGHADALSVEVYAHGQSWLVDPGVYSTHLGWQWRRFFRGTAAHNTVLVDEQDQSRLLDGRRVYRPAHTTLHSWKSNATFDYVAGAHNGYAALAAPITHYRQLFFVKGDYWVVVDDLLGPPSHALHTFDLLWHFAPGLAVDYDLATQRICATNGRGERLELLLIGNDEKRTNLGVEMIAGATEPVQGWVSLRSGEKLPAPTVRCRRMAAAPVRFCTLIYPQPVSKRARCLSAKSLAVSSAATAENPPPPLALEINMGDHCDHLLLAPGTEGTEKRFGAWASNQELFYIRTEISA
jgi:hypothetical protein